MQTKILRNCNYRILNEKGQFKTDPFDITIYSNSQLPLNLSAFSSGDSTLLEY